MYLGILLKRMGFDTLTAGDGYGAMGLVEACRPDIVLAADTLPQFDALTALREFGSDPDCYAPSCVLMTSSPESDTEENRLRIGACTLLTKPATADSLHDAVQVCLFKPTGHIRRHIRASIGVKLTVYHDSGERELFTDTLSEGGTFIRTDDPLPAGEVVNVFRPCGGEECLFLTGKVIYTRSSKQGLLGSATPGFAIEFMDMGDEDRRSLSDFVSCVMTEDIGTGVANEHEERLDKLSGSRKVYAALRSYAGGVGSAIAARAQNL
jgi:CheY-like chemotaxis protein